MSIRVSIMQPTYLPWSGNFAMMNLVDEYVFLDDVQFNRRSWQCRNKILSSGSELYLSIPTIKCSQNTLIKNIFINDQIDWRVDHVKKLRHCYNNAEYSHEFLDELCKIILDKNLNQLSIYNSEIIKFISESLEINVKFSFASSIPVGGKRSKHLLNICQSRNATSYLSPIGSKEYLQIDGDFKNSNVKLEFLDFSPKQYLQMRSERFISHLSIVDVIANIGIENTKKYLKTASFNE